MTLLGNNQLKVTVLKGCNIKCTDRTVNVAPYCLLQVGSTTYKTKLIKNRKNPIWNEEFMFYVTPGNEFLSIFIWHQNTDKEDSVIGQAFVDFTDFEKGECTHATVELKGIFSGEIDIMLMTDFETTKSKVERLDNMIGLLGSRVDQCDAVIGQLKNDVDKVNNRYDQLSQINKLLENDKLLEEVVFSVLENEVRTPKKDVIDSPTSDESSDVGYESLINGYEFECLENKNKNDENSLYHKMNSQETNNDENYENNNCLIDTSFIDNNDNFGKQSPNWDMHFIRNIKRLEEELSKFENQNNEQKESQNLLKKSFKCEDIHKMSEDDDSNDENTKREKYRKGDSCTLMGVLDSCSNNKNVDNKEDEEDVILSQIIQLSDMKSMNENKIQILRNVIRKIELDITNIIVTVRGRIVERRKQWKLKK